MRIKLRRHNAFVKPFQRRPIFALESVSGSNLVLEAQTSRSSCGWYHVSMPLRVACYSGYRSEQEPLAFWLGERRLEVQAIVDRWYGPAQRWFKVDADDGNAYVLSHDERNDEWDIAAFTASRQPATP